MEVPLEFPSPDSSSFTCGSSAVLFSSPPLSAIVVAFLVISSCLSKFPTVDTTSNENAWCFDMGFVDKFIETNGVSPIKTPITKETKKWKRALFQTCPLDFDLSDGLEDLGEKTP
jgi:hypothetical protein